ncbi:MAG TPA: DUF2461 domain-containing protein [Lutibacter sp.]|nr:DUF2461 domain-containing protein [Lutibacter sp.]
MKYFTKKYLKFFKNLAANNHKDWFDENRKEYEQEVREPFKFFIGDLIKAIGTIDKEIQLEPKNAIFRINRDVRFSKDKTPYKLFNSAIISKGGRKDKTYPGLYIELNPEKLGVYGGLFMPDTKQVYQTREYIISHAKEFDKIINDKKFTKYYGIIKGKQHIRIPKEFRESAEQQNLLYNKQWYYEAALSPKIILKDNLLETIVDYYKVSNNLQRFLIKAYR